MVAEWFLQLPRYVKRLVVLLTDFLILPLGIWIAFSLRLGEFFIPVNRWEDARYLFVLAPVVAFPVFIKFGLYRSVIRYLGFDAVWAISKAVTLYTLVFGVLILLSGFSGIPRSVLLINWLVTLILVGSTRMAARWWLTGNFRLKSRPGGKKKVAIYGAGEAGTQIAAALAGSSEYKAVAFIDDNRSLQGHYVQGLRVYSYPQLSTIIERLSVTEVLLAMPSISRSRRSRIISNLEPYAVHVTILPGVNDLASGKIKVGDMREVGVQDLLGRISVEPNQNLLKSDVLNKTILVTGAGGSIGSELCRQIVKIKPTALILYERGERDLYAIEKELIELHKNLYPDEEIYITPILASITNKERLQNVCETFAVETIYHAAAYKHVPMVEKNPSEAVHNNVLGTYCAAMAAVEAGVETFVLISTDKAVRPTSTMGATKRFAEIILQGLARRNDIHTRFCMVRFGNVLDSSGSVVPLFRDQIQKGGPVTVTDPNINRYFMTIPEAAQLVIQAGAMGKGGEVFVLDMGQPVRIQDLARRLIHLSGLEVKDEAHPDGDIEITYTGLRPGEKLYEELLIGENVTQTKHPLIMAANEIGLSWDLIERYIDHFGTAIRDNKVEISRSLLLEAVAGFKPQCDIADLVVKQNIKLAYKNDKAQVLKYRSKS